MELLQTKNQQSYTDQGRCKSSLMYPEAYELLQQRLQTSF